MPTPPARQPGRGPARDSRDGQLPLVAEASVPRRYVLVRLITELQRRIAELGQVVVEGEVHQATKRPDGRWFFTLRDRAAQMQVMVPPSVKRARVVDGERVAVTGMVVTNPGRGVIRIDASEVLPVGEGAVAAMIAEARERLRADGLLDRPRKPLPLMPRRIMVVCGAEAAVKHDISSTVDQRFPGYPVGFVEVSMTSADSIVAGVRRALQVVDVDVVVLARGGGDATHLLPFSDELLCRVVAASPVPVVSAIGHQNDRPLCDEVADVRVGTPSMAAALVVPDERLLRARIDAAVTSMSAAASMRVDRAELRLRAVGTAWSRAPHDLLARSERRVAELDARGPCERRIEGAGRRLGAVDWRHQAPRSLERGEARLAGLIGRIDALSPERVLARGYAVVRDGDGRVIRDPSTLQPGDDIVVTVHAGSVEAQVLTVDTTPPHQTILSSPVRGHDDADPGVP